MLASLDCCGRLIGYEYCEYFKNRAEQMKQEVSVLTVTGTKYEMPDEMWPKINT